MSTDQGNKEATYTLDILPDSQIALFHWSGPITLTDREQNRRIMAEFCKRHGVRNIIVDGRDQVSKTGIFDSFYFAQGVPREMHGLRIAVVHRSDDEALPFIEMVASNRGSHTRAFLNFDEARAWLESLDAPS